MMNNYTESKKALDKIRNEYSCKGDVLFRTAIQTVVEYGTSSLLDDWDYEHLKGDINERHDNAEAEGKNLWITRNFELAILECAREIAQVDIYDMLMYIQREVWLSSDGMDYQRIIDLLKKCMADIEESYHNDNKETYDVFEYIGFTDDEIEMLGFGYMLNDVEGEE